MALIDFNTWVLTFTFNHKLIWSTMYWDHFSLQKCNNKLYNRMQYDFFSEKCNNNAGTICHNRYWLRWIVCIGNVKLCWWDPFETHLTNQDSCCWQTIENCSLRAWVLRWFHEKETIEINLVLFFHTPTTIQLIKNDCHVFHVKWWFAIFDN